MVDFERLRPQQREWDLGGIERLLRRDGAAPSPGPAVQVAGSKGKGTTAAFLEALGSAGGRRVGCYSSPHVTTMRERVRVAGELVPVGVLEEMLQDLLAVDPERPPTFFEAMTAAAVEWFARERVDLAVYEVGLGGRHDATTAIPVDASIVTRIELEHTEVLGDTVAAIAGEKAPVIRAGGLGVTGTTGDALAVVRRHADAVGAELLVAGEDFGVRALEHGADAARGELWLPDGSAAAFELPGASAFSLPALGLAAATLNRLLPELPLQLNPAPAPCLPCRFEAFDEPDGEVLVLDGAHTEDSLRAVASELRRRMPGCRPAVLTAVAAGKRWREGLSAMLEIADSFVVTELSGTPGEDPAEISAWLAARGARSEVATDWAAGFRALRARPGPRVVVGSFYLAGAVRGLVDGNQARQLHEREP
ncbi:MAG: hypothetical protein VYA51_05445 [Planctomycetota bacterium]|nr:hypothetical protein [Planctomycetota bacterium]MEC9047437.1 hypothetical protein [Planctomycetota bacterium]